MTLSITINNQTCKIFRTLNKKIKFSSLILASACLLSSCDKQPETVNPQVQAESHTPQVESAKQQSLDELYSTAVQILFQARAMSATMFGVSLEDVRTYYADQLEDYSPEKEQQLRQQLLSISQKIAQHPQYGESLEQLDNQLVMTNLTRYFAGNADISIGYVDVWMGLSPFILNQINGPLIDIPRYMQSDQIIRNEKDALDYISRLSKFDKMVNSVQRKLAADEAKGWIPTKVTLAGVNRYLSSFTQSAAAKHPLVKTFAEKLSKLDNLSTEQKQSLVEQAVKNVSDVVYPAYRSIAQYSEKLTDKAREESGVWAQPNGAAFYKDAIRQLGDSDLEAEEIHLIGIAEVERITKQMDAILQQQGYSKGTVGSRMVSLNDEPRFLYPDSASGRQALLSDLNGYIDEITAKMSTLFKTKPQYQVEVRAFPVEIQDGAPGGQYTSPAVDGSKPGIYWINLRDMKANPKFGLKTLTYHEATPGHHWQLSLNLAQESLPFLRRIAPYNAYVEGWALYSERVAFEMGLYENDPFGNLGRLQAELFRAVRLVVDTGLHHKRWTREQAIQYMSDKTGTAESDVISEIERYMVWPGQALGYKMGMLKILQLREKAKTELKQDFELAEFHDLVLLGGAVPMAILENKVNQWIASKQPANE